METVVELFNEDLFSHPRIPHVFSIPCLMTHLCRRQLSKDVDVLLTINVGTSFLTCSMHESLVLLIILTLLMFQTTEVPG